MLSPRPKRSLHRPAGKLLRRAAVLGIAVFAVAGAFPVRTAAAPVAPDPARLQPTVVTERLEGADRFGIAISISGQLSRRAAVPVVYLVSGSPDSEAAAAGPAAAREGAAILYTEMGSLPPAVAAELVRLDPVRVDVIGGTQTISNAVLRRVASLLGPDAVVRRVSARTPYGTAAALSARLYPVSGVEAVFIAAADSYADAIAAGPAAALLGAPLLLVGRDVLPSETAAELRRLAPRHLFIVGNAAAVDGRVLAAIAAIVPGVERVSGSDRYATASAVAARLFPEAGAVVATSGLSDLGGLSAVPLAAAIRAPILFTQGGDQLPAATRDRLIAGAPHLIYMTGRMPEVIRGQLIGFSDGRLTVAANDGTYPSWDSGYHDPAEMLTVIKATEIAYPSLVRVFSIGKSFEGRDIWAAKVSDNVAIDEDEPEVLVDALHHASEHLGVEQALYLLGTLTSGYAGDAQVRRLVDEREVWIIFAVNPDGWAYDLSGDGYQFWRKNRQPNGKYNPGTDLNRNYSYMWGCCEASSGDPWTWNYRGPTPFSAPETTAVADFVKSRVIDGRQQIRTHVTLHTNGEMILYPFSYTLARLPGGMDPDDYAVFRSMARTMAGMNGYSYKQSSFLYPSDGDEIDWMYTSYRIFSFTFELYPNESAGKGIIYPSDSVIARQTARNRSALLYLIEAAACPYAAIGKAATYCPVSPSPDPRH
jgi:carboxypeptidase T